MKVKYDREVDILYISLNEGPVSESDESKPGIIIDYDESGNPVGIEILSASTRIAQPGQVIIENAA